MRNNNVTTLLFDSKPTSIHCHFGDFGCGDGAWTPVMKIDGNEVSQRCQCKSFLSLSSVDKDWPFFSTALI